MLKNYPSKQCALSFLKRLILPESFQPRSSLEAARRRPRSSQHLNLENSKIAGFSYAGLVASGNYRDQKAEVKATVQQDQLHTLNATATLPMTVSWNNGWRAEAAE